MWWSFLMNSELPIFGSARYFKNTTNPVQAISIRTSAWFGDNQIPLAFPDACVIHEFKPGHAAPLSDESIRTELSRSFAAYRHRTSKTTRVVFVIDDLGRPTPASVIIAPMLDILSNSGISSNNISFVIATGSHRQLSDEELAKKLGAPVLAEFSVTSHDAFLSPLEYLGTLANGLPCFANRQVATADLIIGIGCVLPHACHGFGGGAKLFCPGIAGMESIVFMHGFTPKRGRSKPEDGVWDMREVSEAFADKLPPVFLINVLVNAERQICRMASGDFRLVYSQLVADADRLYRLEHPDTPFDFVVANHYPLDADPVQADKSSWVGKIFPESLVIHILNTPDGMDYHGWKKLRRSSLITLLILLYFEILNAKSLFGPLRRWLTGGHIGRVKRALVRNIVRHSKAEFPSWRDRVIKGVTPPAHHGSLDWTKRPIVFSPSYPPELFYKKYKNGLLIKDWSLLTGLLSSAKSNPRIAVLTCAPLQFVKPKGPHEDPH